MKFMMIMRVSPAAEEASEDVSFNELVETMGRYNAALMEAGVLLTAEGLAPAEEGFVVDFGASPPAITDGPFAESRYLFNGFWVLNTATREEAEVWASRCPLGPGVRLEVRRVAEVAPLGPDHRSGTDESAPVATAPTESERVIQW